jgi:Tic22-like family
MTSNLIRNLTGHSNLKALGLTLGVWATSLATLAVPLMAPMGALALPAEQVIEKLARIPVFAIVDTEKGLLGAPGAINGKKLFVAQVFLSKQEADQALTEAKAKKPDLAKATVQPVSMAVIYVENQNAAKGGTEKETQQRLGFNVIPDGSQIKLALEVLKGQGQTVDRMGGIPVFFPQILKPGQTEPEVMPLMFLRKEDLQQELAQAQQKVPELAKSKITIQVTTLDRVVEAMLANADASFGQINFVPSRLSEAFQVNASPTGLKPGATAPGAKPAAKPATPARPAAAPAPKKPR